MAAVAVNTSQLSAEQLAFLERKRSQSSSPAPAVRKSIPALAPGRYVSALLALYLLWRPT